MGLGIVDRSLDTIGSLVDELFLAPARLTLPLFYGSGVDLVKYEKQLDYYIDNGYTNRPETFLTLPESLPGYSVIDQSPYSGGKYEVISYSSGYEVRNPLLREAFSSYKANQTGYLVRWRHGDTPRKTVLCVHGFMMGEPVEARRMFRMDKLYAMGLDVALFIHPFHWRRSPGGRAESRIYLRPDNAGFMSECIGQSVYDLGNSLAILRDQGTEEIGLIGASLGAYVLASLIGKTFAPRFAALMVPAVSFLQPVGPGLLKKRMLIDDKLWDKVRSVCELTSPLNLSPQLPPENILVVASRGDRVCPIEPLLELCRKWNLTRCHIRTGGHWLVFTKTRGRAWYGFLHELGFTSQ